MKHLILGGLLCLCGLLRAQNVAINNDGSPPDSSAILDVKSTNAGLLIPRMSTSDRNGINNPATGLMIFDTDSNSFWCWSGTSWIEIMQGFVTLLRDEDNDTKVQVEETSDDDVIRFDMEGTEFFRMDSGRIEVSTLPVRCSWGKVPAHRMIYPATLMSPSDVRR